MKVKGHVVEEPCLQRMIFKVKAKINLLHKVIGLRYIKDFRLGI